LPASRTLVKRRTVNNSGIGILCSKNSNGRLAVPAVAGLLVVLVRVSRRNIAKTFVMKKTGMVWLPDGEKN